MWKFESEGRGRRSVVLSVSKGPVRYRVGDFVECNGFVGAVVAFRQGETDRSHEAQLLQFDSRDGELLATSLLKWYALEEMGTKCDKENIVLRRAIDHHRHHREKIEDLPEDIRFDTAQDLINLSSTVASLFLRSVTPKKRQSPTKQSSAKHTPTKSPAKRSNDEAEQSPVKKPNLRHNGDLNLPKFEPSDDELSDGEFELVPARKRKTAAKLSSQLASATLESPKKPKQPSVPLTLEDDEDSEAESSVESPGPTKLNVKADQPSMRRGLRKTLPLASSSGIPEPSPVDRAVGALHPASDPGTHLCRDSQFDQLFLALESAIAAETGTCVYVSGTPGTGKTSVIREVIGQLDLRVHEKELKPFTFLEINGMKLVHPSAAYEHLWEALGRGQMAASNAMTALEAAFSTPEPLEKRGVIVLLLDELDQLVTKGQQLMYNFFNWPSLPHSRLVVVAVANTMDLPERVMSNKISSRVGLTRIQFPGYTHGELKDIVSQRLGDNYNEFVEDEAIEYAARKVAGVGGDARRVLDFLRQAIQLAADQKTLPAKVSDIRDVSVSSQIPPLGAFIKTLGVATKVLLCAVLARARRTGNIETSLHDVLKQASQFVRSAVNSDTLMPHLYPGRSGRLAFFQPAVMELVESGILVQQAIKGEATPRVRLMVPAVSIKEYLEFDPVVKGMV